MRYAEFEDSMFVDGHITPIGMEVVYLESPPTKKKVSPLVARQIESYHQHHEVKVSEYSAGVARLLAEEDFGPNKLAHINGEYLVVPLPERTLSTYLGAGWLQRANLSQLKLAFLEYDIEATFGDTRREDRDSKLKYPGIYYQQAVVLNIKLPEEVD